MMILKGILYCQGHGFVRFQESGLNGLTDNLMSLECRWIEMKCEHGAGLMFRGPVVRWQAGKECIPAENTKINPNASVPCGHCTMSDRDPVNRSILSLFVGG